MHQHCEQHQHCELQLTTDAQSHGRLMQGSDCRSHRLAQHPQSPTHTPSGPSQSPCTPTELHDPPSSHMLPVHTPLQPPAPSCSPCTPASPHTALCSPHPPPHQPSQLSFAAPQLLHFSVDPSCPQCRAQHRPPNPPHLPQSTSQPSPVTPHKPPTRHRSPNASSHLPGAGTGG